MRINERQLQGTTILELQGALTSPYATDLLNATVRRVARAGPRRLVLHLGNVPSIDAGGLGALVTAYGLVRRRGGALRLAHVAKRVHTLLSVCRLITVFETFDSVEAAVADGSGVGQNPSTTSPRAPQVSKTSLDVIEHFLQQA